MPVLAGWLLSLVAGITGWLSSFVAKRVAVGVAYGSVLVAGWVAFQLAAFGLWSAIGFVMPGFMADVMRVVLYLLPSNFFPCVGALVSVRILRWAWEQQREYVRAVSAIG